ncbi:MFS transporter [Oleiharenicola sp. Vm1]|uniref:MFS transporter n=1 Tax=Oleiharenicola sp. Vm1 TaxID=3398393 RepID=UPI0039F59228
MKDLKPLTLPAIWNMSFGFFGIQFGWGLQMANMSAIYQYLGASEGDIPILWLAAPLTGLIVQPIIGYYSDRTWHKTLGRRRPYFLVGAILASLCLLAMPNSGALWMAAGLLWILDASVNVSMEPFRAFVADLMPPHQRQVGFAMQSLLIGLGAVLSSSLPWLLTQLGVTNDAAHAGAIPQSVRLAFYIGAGVYLLSVLYTIVTTREHPPEAEPAAKDAAAAPMGFVGEILHGISHMPHVMRRLAVVQFFTWLGLFCMWIYFGPAIAHGVFGGQPGSPAYQRGIEWGGVCFATYNGVAFAVSFVLVALAQRGVPAKAMHRVGLLCAGAGLLSAGFVHEPKLLIVSMVGVGIGWATILSMPYALLSNSIPPAQMGFYMGVFNFFIVLPQILAATVLGPVVQHLLGGRAIAAVMVGGASMLVAALALQRVPEAASTQTVSTL